jgi:hypothetical protein
LIFINADIGTKVQQIPSLGSHWDISFWRPTQVQAYRVSTAGQFEHNNFVQMKGTDFIVAYM